MHDTIFREYDIRGKIGSEFLIEKVPDLARALGTYFLSRNPTAKTVAIGMDGRLTSPAIKESIITALHEMGLDTLFVGVCPSPVLYFAAYTLPVDAALMITASHNPGDYNGVKIMLGKKTVWGKQIQEIHTMYQAHAFTKRSGQGNGSEIELIPIYIDWLYNHFKSLEGMQLPVVIDCGNGVAGTVLPALLQKMNWSYVHLLYPEVDGTYPNHEADPVIEKNMVDVKKLLATTDMQLGVGLDGDCDRMAAMTKDGFLVPGDQLLAIFAFEIIKEHPGAGIVFDVKSSSGLIELLQRWGAQSSISPAGHAIIKDMMEKTHALLGGELSCHFFFKERYFGYDDGIYALMRLIEIIVSSGKSLQQLLAVFPKKYTSIEIRLACPQDKKQSVINAIKDSFAQRADVSLITVDGVRVIFPYGWGIVRASNTQPVLSMRFESDTPEGLAQTKQDFVILLSRYFDKKMFKDI